MFLELNWWSHVEQKYFQETKRVIHFFAPLLENLKSNRSWVIGLPLAICLLRHRGHIRAALRCSLLTRIKVRLNFLWFLLTVLNCGCVRTKTLSRSEEHT